MIQKFYGRTDLAVSECPIKECLNSADCGILDIIKKVPKDRISCSYFEDEKSMKKKRKRRTQIDTSEEQMEEIIKLEVSVKIYYNNNQEKLEAIRHAKENVGAVSTTKVAEPISVRKIK